MIADPRENHLKYEPAPKRPDDFNRRLKQIVGRCPTGEPYLRFSWGMDVTEILDGVEMHRYPDPDGKYIGMPFWVLEGWQSSDVYDRANWKQNEDLLGPFPENGVWDFIATVQDEKKRFLPLGSFALSMARDWRHWRSKTKARVLEDLLKDRCKLQVLKEARWEDRKNEILETFIQDFSRAERGGYDPRNRSLVGTISKGKYQESPSGLLIPKLI